MNAIPIIAAGAAYFALGGLWFTPLFGRAWDRAVGFDRPARWRPPIAYDLGPLIGCMVIACAISALMQLAGATTLPASLQVGLIAGLGIGATVTGINAISPNVPRPALYAAVVGSYHLVGALLCTVVIQSLGS